MDAVPKITKKRRSKASSSNRPKKKNTVAGNSRISHLVDVDMGTGMSTGPVTRAKARLHPRLLESESESGGESCDDHSIVTRPGPPRLQQPNVYVLGNLMKVKMEVDYNPIIAPPKVEVKVEDGENGLDSNTTNNHEMGAPGAPISGSVKEEPASDHDDQESSSCSKPPEKNKSSTDSLSATKTVEKSVAKQDSNDASVSTSVETTLTNTKRTVLPLQSSKAEDSISGRPTLTIILRSSEPKIVMTKKFQSQKIRFFIESTEEFSSKLETEEKDHEVWLTVFENVLQDSTPFITTFATTISTMNLPHGALTSVSPYGFQELLCGLPNLEHLFLFGVPLLWGSEKKTFPHQNGSSLNSSCLLPKMKTISFSACDSYYPEILMGLFQLMPNLQKIFHFPLGCITNSEAHDMLKIDKIRSANFSIHTDSERILAEFSSLESISQKVELRRAHFPVEQLSLVDSPDLWTSCCESWSRILENNKRTLINLKIEPFSLAKNLKYPRMEAVKKLCMHGMLGGKENGVKFFGENFHVHKKFPNLMEVTLESKSCTFDQFCEFLPEDACKQEYFKGVTILHLNFEFNWLWDLQELDKVAPMFPDVTELYINGISHWVECSFAQLLQLWPKLIILKIYVKRWMRDDGSYLLDLAFTGIPAVKCRKLRKDNEKIDIDLPKYRQNFAISNMKGLKQLTLIFDLKREYARELNGIPVISHVAAFYGFQCVPDLKVTFAIPWDNECKDKILKMLSPVEEYVSFNPNYVE